MTGVMNIDSVYNYHSVVKPVINNELAQAFRWTAGKNSINDISDQFLDYSSHFDACYILCTKNDNPMNWHYVKEKETLKTHSRSEVNGIHERTVGNHVDIQYMKNAVLPTYMECLNANRSLCHKIAANIEGKFVLYERLSVPFSESGSVSFLALFTKILMITEAIGHEKHIISKREREVVSLIASGLSIKQISARLTMSEKTVEFHMSNVRKKLGARNTVQAITKVFQKFLLE